MAIVRPAPGDRVRSRPCECAYTKSALLHALLWGLAPGIRDGLMDVRACDPKGGMELAPAAGLFTAFAYRPHDMVECSSTRRGR